MPGSQRSHAVARESNLRARQPAQRPAHEKEPAPKKDKAALDRELDQALADSFPASDPPAPAQPTGTEPAGDPEKEP